MKRLLGSRCGSGAGELWSSSAICWEEARPGEAGEASAPPAVGSCFNILCYGWKLVLQWGVSQCPCRLSLQHSLTTART